MKHASTSPILDASPAFAAIWLAATAPAPRWTDDAKVFGRVAPLTPIGAALLVMCFDWRDQPSRRMLADRKDHRTVTRLAPSRLVIVRDRRRGHWPGACDSVRG